MRALFNRLRYFLRRSHHEADLREEMETHRSLRQAKLERDGAAPAEAEHASRRALGNATLAREDARGVWIGQAVESFWQDVRSTLRAPRRRPAFAAAVIGTIGLGIGGSTAMFSIVDAVLLRPLPYQEPDRLVRIWESNPAEASERSVVSAAIANDWRARSRTLDDLALFDLFTDPTVVGIGSESLQLRQADVTPNLFALLGVRPAIGRDFDAVDDPRGPLEPRDVIVSHALWQRAFGGSADIIGQAVRIEGVAGNVVVGVMPAGFSFPEGTDLWTATRADSNRYDWRQYGAIGRLAAGTSVGTAEADLRQIAASVAAEHADTSAHWTVVVASLHDSVVGAHRLALVTAFAAVVFVVLIGCANVSNLVLTRSLARRGELAVRAALGASRARIARLLMAETAVLATIGGAAGGLFAGLLLPLLIQLAGPHVPRLAGARLSGSALAFAAVATMVAAIVSGILPAIRVSRADPRVAIDAEGDRATWTRSNVRIQRAIVAAELAACLVLLVGATLFAQTFVRLRAVDLGFDPEHVVSVETRVPIYRTLAPDRWQRVAADATEALRRLRALPGVQAASTTSDLPLAGTLLATEVTPVDDARPRQAFYHRVSPGYFRTMGMTIVAGRDFTNEDIGDLARLPAIPDPRTATPRQGAVIVNETMARMLWPDAAAVGRYLSTGFDTVLTDRRRVVGIVRDARSETPRQAAPPEVYVPYLEDPGFVMTLLVRTTRPADRIAAAIRHELREVSPDLSMANIRMLDDVVDDATRSSRFSALVVGSFATASLLLSALGVFGVFAFGIAARVREIGIRMALGATAADITRLFLRQAIVPIGAGVAVGTAGALALGRFVQALLFDVEPTDVASYLAAVSTLVIVAVVASYLPVRRLLRTDPARSLRG